uniref:CCHC-type domain-containing protein n=1 Tax=Strigamia maritima TaxID=126957 RepID=T1JDD0_STRMM
MSCPVRAYIPNPLRCFKCQKFGHTQQSCRFSPACDNCGGADHIANICTASSPSCVNCRGAHPASSRQCPTYTFEKRIQEYKVSNNVSYFEAKKSLSVGRLVSSWAETVKRRCDASSQVGADEDFVPRPSDRILVPSCLRSSQTKGSSSSAVTSDGSFKVPSNKLVKPTKSSTSSAKNTDAEPNSKDERKTKGDSGGPNGSPPADPNISNQPAKEAENND